MNTIVLAYDDSEPSQRALERSAQLTKAFGAKLIVTSITPMMASGGRSAGPIDPTDPPEKHAAELAAARTHLDGEGIEAEYVPGIGDVADTIAVVAREHNADLIVVGTRELNALQRLLGQSVSARVTHQAECDVLIVH
jgi:nucleotide-binding universal stress UspA family protein